MRDDPGVEVVGESEYRTASSGTRPVVETVFSVEGFDLCRTRRDPSETTPWHDHGERTAYGVVLAGRDRIEFGPAGDAVDVGPGEFFVVPPGQVHRELTVDTDDVGGGDGGEGKSEEVVALVGLAGRGPLVVEADGPGTVPSTPPRVAGDADLVPAGWLANVTRLMPFPDAPVQQVRGHAAGAVESSWHHHGDNHVFGHVLNGEGYVEWGTGPGERKLVRAGEWFHLPPGVVHRDVNPSDEEQDYLLWLTGSEPRTVPVDGPDGGDEGA